MRRLTFLHAILLGSGCVAAADSIYHDGWNDLNKNGLKDAYEDPSQPVEQRVTDLLARMTLDEKIGQLQLSHREVDAEKRFGDAIRQGRVSSFLDGSQLIETPTQRNRLQRLAVEQSRLGSPLIFGHDSIHGFRTIFPIPLAMACAWEPGLFERAQTVSARETAAVGIDWTFAPMVDLTRDPRWGRIAEGFGEDPWLASLDAAACVRGFQGSDPGAADRLLACLKHYVGYGAAEGGRDYNTTEISEYTLRNCYLPQFKAGLDAGAWTVMSAFNCLSGYPASGNRHALTEILRDEWHFPGCVVSDWTSVEELVPHGVAEDAAQAARIAITAGVDMEMVSTTYADTMRRQVASNQVAPAVIDQAVRRVLGMKFAKGLFDRPYVDEALYTNAFLTPDAIAISREAAAKSCVLLKNQNGTLPISRNVKSIAVLGPFGDDGGSLLGCWAARGRAEDCVSIAQGIRSKLSPDAEILTVRGCEASTSAPFMHKLSGTLVIASNAPTAGDAAEIDKALAAARSADVVLLALGEPSNWTGENASRSDLDLPGRQMGLFDAVAALGKPVIVVLVNGRPLTLPRLQARAAAILEAWDPGVQGGNGIADILFGDVEPAGRLTVTFPQSIGQVPLYYNHLNTGRPTLGEYVDGPRAPLYPFGFGLTYTTFQYGPVRLSTPELRIGQKLAATVQLKNRAVAATAGPRPVRELKGFQKVRLGPGEARELTFTITGGELGYSDALGKWRLEPGRFQVWIAGDSESGAEPVPFEVVK